jgi:probable F420-dependent oxidoreductase
MNFGVVLQTNPPAARVIDLACRAETYGFSHAWTFDSHLLWEEPFVIYSRILDATHKLTVGPMVTNPATRDWTVTASMFATLNEMYGNRTVCGIGRGDSAVRTLNGKPVNLADLSACVKVIRGLANGEAVEYRGSTLRFPWNPSSRLQVWVAAYGPKALKVAGEVGDGYILQLADPDIAAWSIQAVRDAAAAAGRDPDALTMCVAAPAYVTDGSQESRAHALDQCRWFGGMVGNHVADIVARYGSEGAAVPTSLTDYIAGRRGYDYNEHGRAGNTHTEFVPDEIVERFCIIGPPETHVARLKELAALGVGHFGLYLQHDAQDATLAAYGNEVIPAVSEQLLARS